MPDVITVDPRFRGPPATGNGGYVCGLMAAAIRRSVRVRLHRPVPLATALAVIRHAEQEWRLVNGAETIATATPATVDLLPPRPPGYLQALAAARRYAGFNHHFYPDCFVCGPRRAQGDGLRIFPGALAGGRMVAAPWLPEVSLTDADGKVKPEFIWAALDCPGYFAALPNDRPAVLGELAVRIDRRAPADEPCVIVGWPISADGRKHLVGTALYTEEGDLCAIGAATWIELAT